MFKKAVVIGMICLSIGSIGFARTRTIGPDSISLATEVSK